MSENYTIYLEIQQYMEDIHWIIADKSSYRILHLVKMYIFKIKLEKYNSISLQIK